MNLSELDVRQTITYINNSFQDFAKRCPYDSAFKIIQQTSWDNLQGLAFLFLHDPKILDLIKSTQDVIKKTEFQPDGVGRSSAQPSGDVGQEGNS